MGPVYTGGRSVMEGLSAGMILMRSIVHSISARHSWGPWSTSPGTCWTRVGTAGSVTITLKVMGGGVTMLGVYWGLGGVMGLKTVQMDQMRLISFVDLH